MDFVAVGFFQGFDGIVALPGTIVSRRCRNETNSILELTAWPSGSTWTDTCPGYGWDRGVRRGSAHRVLAPSVFAGCAEDVTCLGEQIGIRGIEEMPLLRMDCKKSQTAIRDSGAFPRSGLYKRQDLEPYLSTGDRVSHWASINTWDNDLV